MQDKYADTLETAVELAKGCPVLKGGASISVFETFNAMGSDPLQKLEY